MERQYPKSHITRIMAIDGLVLVIGLALIATPFVKHFFPGDVDTTVHVALGALIAVLSFFRLALGYGSIWIDFCLFWLGLIVLRLPVIMHMQWNSGYNTAHLAAGGIVMAVAVLAAILTIPVNRTFKSA